MKTIIGFDSWTEGSHHYVRLVSALRRRGYRLILIHIGSWGHDKNRPREEHIGDLLVRDVSYYQGKSLKEILEQEKPAAVVFLSTRAFAHQTFNLYAAQLRIPTLHLYHGILNAADVSDMTRDPFQLSWPNQLRLITTRVYKNAFVLWPRYWKALIETRAPIANWYWFGREIHQKAIRNCSGIAPPDASTTEGCVYTQVDVQHMIKFYNMPPENVHAVGNPDIVRFGLKMESIGAGLNPARRSTNEVVYIATALLESGVIFKSMDEVVSTFAELDVSMRHQGFALVMKLHPSQESTELPERLRQIGIEVCDNKTFVQRLESAACAIAEPSSAAILPALVGVPLFLAQYGKLAEQRYGILLTSYPRAQYLRDPAQLKPMIEQESASLQPQSVTKWIEENAGPLPAEEMPDRVASVIDRMVLAASQR
jgi:hypothetical protein